MPVQDAARFVTLRARLMQDAPAGAMLAVALPEEETTRFVERGADLAAVNGPRAVVLSGPDEVMDEIEAELTRSGVPRRRLAVNRAFHSRLMDGVVDELRQAAAALPLTAPSVPFVSNVTGDWITAEQATNPGYWATHARVTVRFADGLNAVLAAQPGLLLEAGPGHTLISLVRRHPDRPKHLVIVPSLPDNVEDEARHFAHTLATVWSRGWPVNWETWQDGAGLVTALPTYPFQRQSYWASAPEQAIAGHTDRPAVMAAPELAVPASTASGAGPRPDLAAVIRQAFQEALGIASIGDDDTFFDLGGDSLVAVQVVLALRSRLDVELALRDFVGNATVRRLTALIDGNRTGPLVTPATNAPDTQPVAARPAAPDTVSRPAAWSVPATTRQPGLSVFFFAAGSHDEDRYGFLRACAQAADELGFTAIWMPERHFHRFGELFPNPAVLAAGLATMTQRIGLRAGSVVAPLHHPARIAEEWAVVDNLSGGRVGLAFAPGFLPLDFVFSQAAYGRKEQVALDRIDKVRRLWRGEPIDDINGTGEHVQLHTFPRPVQSELPVWFTAASNPHTFTAAGRHGFHLLTALLNLTTAELEERIITYRKAREKAGHDPAGGIVTLMVHGYVGEGDDADVRAAITTPFRDYLWANSEIIRSAAKALLNNMDLDRLTPADRETLLDFAFDRYFGSDSLLASGPTFQSRAAHLYDIGVNEIACLIDFGMDLSSTLASMRRMAALLPQATACPPR
jgi:natural product biosynthesis luciferase-like monooxygenase protein